MYNFSNDTAQKSGITLTELLATLAVTSIILTALFAAYFTVVHASVRQTADSSISAATRVLDALTRDFMCLTVSDTLTNSSFILKPQPDNLSGSFTFCNFYTAEPDFPDLPPAAYAIKAVELQLHPLADDEFRLVRISRVYPESANNTNVITETWEPLPKLRVTAFDGEKWLEDWHEGNLPRAMRIVLGSAQNSERVLTTDIPIPAGIPIETTNRQASL